MVFDIRVERRHSRASTGDHMKEACLDGTGQRGRPDGFPGGVSLFPPLSYAGAARPAKRYLTLGLERRVNGEKTRHWKQERQSGGLSNDRRPVRSCGLKPGLFTIKR